MHARGLALIGSFLGVGLLEALAGVALARTDVGVSLGPRGGLQFRGDTDAFVGADIRLTSSLSPLTLTPIFDYYFDEDRPSLPPRPGRRGCPQGRLLQGLR